MFSGIIEATGRLAAVERKQENYDFTFTCPFAGELSADQSVSHNGVCLTVVRADSRGYTVTAMRETIRCSNLGCLRVGDEVNLERSMRMNGRLDGHIVQGHVDCTAECTAVEDAAGSKVFSFAYETSPEAERQGRITAEKGSVAVNGVSLTAFNAGRGSFQVAIIPYTFEHTNFRSIGVGALVNIEFDILGKYIARLMRL